VSAPGTECIDPTSDSCSGLGVCVGIACVHPPFGDGYGYPTPTHGSIDSGATCVPDDACPVFECDFYGCDHVAANCSVAHACTTTAVCDGRGMCIVGPDDCDDDDVCTRDACLADGCVHYEINGCRNPCKWTEKFSLWIALSIVLALILLVLALAFIPPLRTLVLFVHEERHYNYQYTQVTQQTRIQQPRPKLRYLSIGT